MIELQDLENLNVKSTEELISLRKKLQDESVLKGTSQLGKKTLLNSLNHMGRRLEMI